MSIETGSVPRAVVAIVLAAYLAPLFLGAPLTEEDEGLHAAIAQEMVERGDWVVPRFAGQPFLDKPILYFWAEAASIKLLGPSEFAVRLPGTIFALLGALAIGWLAGRMLGAAAASWGALCYATMYLPFASSLAPLHDLVMVPLVVLATGAFREARYSRGNGALAGWTVVAGAALGLSLLGKGLTGAALVGVGVATWLLLTRALTMRLVVAGAVALAIAGAIAWPWYAAMERAVPGYLQYYFMKRHVAGFFSESQQHSGRPFWYYVPILLISTWPWVIFAIRRIRRSLTDTDVLLWCWLVADVVVLSVAGSKLVTYILPAIPAVALLATAARADSTAGDRATLPASLTALAPVGVWIYLTWFVARGVASVWVGVAAIAPALLLVWALVRSRWSGAQRLLLISAASCLVLGVTVWPAAARLLSAQDLATHFNQRGSLPGKILVIDEGFGSMVFYLDPALRRALTPGRIERISRLSLFDVDGPPDTVVAIAAPLVPAVARLYDFPQTVTDGYVVAPRSDFRRRGQ